jgi:hypothetical protein
VLDAAALDKLVADRAALVGRPPSWWTAFDAKGKDTATIKREVVTAKCGDAAVKDKSDAYMDARFDTLVEAIGDASPTAGGDALPRRVLMAACPVQYADTGDAKREMPTKRWTVE